MDRKEWLNDLYLIPEKDEYILLLFVMAVGVMTIDRVEISEAPPPQL